MDRIILTGKEMFEYIREHMPTSKADILKKLNRKIEKYAEKLDLTKEGPVEDSYTVLLVTLMMAFLERIENSVLFDELPEGWVYGLDINYDEFSLNIEHVREVSLREDREYRSHITDAAYKLVISNPQMLTVEKYCQLYHAEQGTVRQWIRRGKIRTACKVGNEWKIPILTPPPSRGYEPAQYKWLGGIDAESLPEEYKFLSDYVIATFYQDTKEKTKFHVLLVSKETIVGTDKGNNKELLLNAKDREKLELFMIAHPQIKYCGTLI